MQIRMKETRLGSPDGLSTYSYQVGQVYSASSTPPVDASLAKVFLEQGWAEEVEAAPFPDPAASAPVAPAPVETSAPAAPEAPAAEAGTAAPAESAPAAPEPPAPAPAKKSAPASSGEG